MLNHSAARSSCSHASPPWIARLGGGAVTQGLPQHHRTRRLACVAVQHSPPPQHGTERATVQLRRAVAGAAATLAAAVLLLAPSPARAELIEMVPASQITSIAKPLAKPETAVDKGRVWLLLVGGAAALFTATLILERSDTLFPAIARANKAMELGRMEQAESTSQDAAEAEWQPAPPPISTPRPAQSRPARVSTTPLVLPSQLTAAAAALSASAASDEELSAALLAKRLAKEEEQRQLEVFKQGMFKASQDVLGRMAAAPASSAGDGASSSSADSAPSSAPATDSRESSSSSSDTGASSSSSEGGNSSSSSRGSEGSVDAAKATSGSERSAGVPQASPSGGNSGGAGSSSVALGGQLGTGAGAQGAQRHTFAGAVPGSTLRVQRRL